MLAGILGGINLTIPSSAPALLGLSVQSGTGFYLLIFAVTLLGAVFIITPVPENTLLFLAGALVVTGQVSLEWLLLVSIAGAYFGYDLNYWSGRLLNLAVCRRFCSQILHAENIEKFRGMIERFGLPASIVISRFIPAVNLPPFIAGLDSMDYGRYVVVNLIGGVLWCVVMVLLGYFIGSLDIIQDYVNILFDLVVLVTVIAIVYGTVGMIRTRIRERADAA